MKITLKMTGCKNNRYELDQILRWSIDHKIPVVDEKEADFCVINTCTVTHVADRKTRQMIRRTKNNNSKLKTIVFGCAARMQKEAFEKIMEIDYLLSDLPAVIGFLEKNLAQSTTSNRRRSNVCSPSVGGRSRALVQIQDGCDNFCAYCIIAAARGPSKNRPIHEIICEINEHHKNGYNEVVLTGINIGAYGAGMTTKYDESTFAELLETILEQTDIPRIRLSSLGPQYFNDRLFEVLKNPRICRHIHLSIQSGSDSVLKRMKRQYTVDQVEEIIHRLRATSLASDVAITTDIIVGFPEETDEEFQETVNFVKRNKLAKVHVFPYSIRQGTVAATMNQVTDDVKKKRAKILQQIADKCRLEFIKSQIGKSVSVLWETPTDGLTMNYIRVHKKGDHPIRSLTTETLTDKMVALN